MNPSELEIKLLKQIADLQGKVEPSAPRVEPMVQPEPELSLKDVMSVVLALRDEIAVLKGSAMPETKELTLIEAVNLCVSLEDRELFSKPEAMGLIEKKLARYFQTEHGKLAMNDFLTYFKG